MTENGCTFDFSAAAVLVTGGTSGIGQAIASAFPELLERRVHGPVSETR